MRSYTAEELQRATGFDRRTIAYYVQERLVPKVGRRGPRTRYPKLVRDRLLFIRRVREAEESGDVPSVSLSEMRAIFERTPAELISSVADGQTPVTENVVSKTLVAARPPARRRAVIKDRSAATENKREATPPPASMQPASEPAGIYEGQRLEMPSFSRAMFPDPDTAELELGESLAALQEAARRRRKHVPNSMDTWSRIEISPEIALSVRGIIDEDAGLLEKVGERLRQLIYRRPRRGR